MVKSWTHYFISTTHELPHRKLWQSCKKVCGTKLTLIILLHIITLFFLPSVVNYNLMVAQLVWTFFTPTEFGGLLAMKWMGQLVWAQFVFKLLCIWYRSSIVQWCNFVIKISWNTMHIFLSDEWEIKNIDELGKVDLVLQWCPYRRGRGTWVQFPLKPTGSLLVLHLSCQVNIRVWSI